jgi:hypothetical protein
MDVERERWMGDLHAHERAIDALARELDRVSSASGPYLTRHDTLFLQAQLTKHRISIALLAARLAEPAPQAAH